MLHDTSAFASPRTHAAAVDLFATINQLDAQATAQLQNADPRVAAYVMVQGTLTTARNPSAAVTAQYLAARQHVALLEGRSLAHAAASAIALSPTLSDSRRDGILARAVRAHDVAATRHVLIAHPDSVFGVDRRGRTA